MPAHLGWKSWVSSQEQEVTRVNTPNVCVGATFRTRECVCIQKYLFPNSDSNSQKLPPFSEILSGEDLGHLVN
jgi:hypothetical protein